MRALPCLTPAALLVLCIGCSNELSGKADVSSEELGGALSIKPTECISGVREGFEGAAVRDESGKVIRLVKDADKGDSVRVAVPGKTKTLTVDKSTCSTFDLHHELQSSTVGEIQNVQGHIKIDCEKDGASMKANITFANCH